jgi:hypothetical protein
MKGIDMNTFQKFGASAVLALSAALAGLAATPGTIQAGDHCCYSPKPCYSPPCYSPKPCYSPPCYCNYQQPCYQPSYHYEYHNDYVKVPYTCYDECGRPYTAYKVEAVPTKVRVAD